MNRALVLACGNPQRSDDSVGLHIANCLRSSNCDPETEIYTHQQWTPELAEPISEAEIVIFVDASANMPPGTIECRQLQPEPDASAGITHRTSPAALLWLAEKLYGKHPARACLVTVGGASFALAETLSDPVSHAIPRAVERIKSLLSGAAVQEG